MVVDAVTGEKICHSLVLFWQNSRIVTVMARFAVWQNESREGFDSMKTKHLQPTHFPLIWKIEEGRIHAI